MPAVRTPPARVASALVLVLAACVSRGLAAAPDPAAEAAAAAGQLADRLKKAAPPKPPGAGCTALYMTDLVAGGTTLVESVGDEAWDNSVFGSPSWSYDGRHIHYDVIPGKEFSETRMYRIELAADGVKRAVVGVGNCPGLSPDGKRLAMYLNPGAVPGADAGVYVAPPAGGKISPTGAHGRPMWSPTGKELLVTQFGEPKRMTLVDPEDAGHQQIALAGYTSTGSPCWAGDKLLACVAKAGDETTVALVDVAKPGEAKVKETLWKPDPAAPVPYTPTHMVYSQAARRGVFVGREESTRKQLYSFEPGKAAKVLDPDRKRGNPVGLALSPDGRYLLFCDSRRD